MPLDRDRFSNLERVRREIDDLFDDVWTRAGFPRGRRSGFKPRVDVYYCGDPAKAIVKADLAGVNPADVNLEVRGRTLILRGERKAREAEGRVYQQVEIESGEFVREISLGGDVAADQAKATYEDGILRVELPLVTADSAGRRVPVSGATEVKPPSDEDEERGQ
jgi:HSP20 family protein